MIRDGEVTDFDALIRMGRKFHAAADAGDIPPFDELSFRRTVSWLIESPDGILLVIDQGGVQGMVGGMVYPAWFNHACQLGQEIFWWAESQVRGKEAMELRRAFESRTRALGAASVIMVSLAGMRDEGMARLYRMEGYRPMEHTFIRSLA